MFDLDFGIEVAEKSGGDRQSGNRYAIAAVHDATKAGIRGNDAFRRNIPASGAQILRQRCCDELYKIETGKFKCHSPAFNGARARSPTHLSRGFGGSEKR